MADRNDLTEVIDVLVFQLGDQKGGYRIGDSMLFAFGETGAAFLLEAEIVLYS